MQAAPAMAIDPLESLTQICLARQLSPETWLRLFQEAKVKDAPDADTSEAMLSGMHTEAIDLVLPLLRETSNDLAQSYLQACLTFDSSKQHLLTRLLESASDMHTHPGEEGKDNAFMEGIAAALLGSDSALISRIPPAKSTSDAAKATQASINLLSMAARYQLSSLFVLTLQLLQLPVPDKLSAVDEELKRSLRQAIAPCRAALFSMMDASAALPYPFQLAQKQLDKLERVLDPVAYRRTTFLKPTTFPSIPLEMTYIIQSVMYDNCANAGNVLGGSIAARLAVNRAVSVATNRLSQQEVLSEWCADLFDSCFVHTNPVNASRSRGGARWRAFAFGRVPGLLRDLKEHAHLTSIACDWTAAVDSGLEHFKERNKAKPAKDLSDWSKVMRDSFKSADERKPASAETSAENLVASLASGVRQYDSQASLAATFLSQTASWTAASDLLALHHFFVSLVKETASIVDYILLHHSPDRLFKPICFVLETWDTSDEYGAGQAMEIFGGILLSLQTIVSRHSLQRSFARFGYGICATIVAPTETLSKPYSLHTLSPQQQGLVSSWIAALYGSEGIEDDLIRNTPPRTMLALAPTIVHQSMIALERGIVDQETLLSGLSYFCQDFLTYTLSSIISYLARQAQPNLTIIKSLIFSESTPACVLELAQDDLRSMTKKLGTDDPDIGLLEKRLQRPDAAVEQELRSTTEIGGAYSVQRLRSAVHERGSQAVLSSIIEGNDPFMASCLATLAFGTDTSTAMQDFVIYAVKRAESLDETAKQAELDKLADYIGLACLRADVDKTVSSKTFHNDVIGRMNLWMDDKV